MATADTTTPTAAAVMTLPEIAREARVSVEVVRQWCIRWRQGKPGGLPYAHHGSRPESECGRVNYRVAAEDWKAFREERRRGERAEDRRITRLVAAPLDYAGRRAEGAGVRGR